MIESPGVLDHTDRSPEQANTMRRRNWRLIITGFVLILLALGFYFFILSMPPSSNDPAALIQTVGTVSGAATGLSLLLIVLSLVLIVLGLIGKKV